MTKSDKILIIAVIIVFLMLIELVLLQGKVNILESENDALKTVYVVNEARIGLLKQDITETKAILMDHAKYNWDVVEWVAANGWLKEVYYGDFD